MPCKIWCARVGYTAQQSKSEIVGLIRDVSNDPGEVPFIYVDLDNEVQVVLGVNHISAIEPA